MPQDVPLAFFSYSREDSEFALKLAADLKAAGANVWIDRLDIKPGQWWDKSVEEALNQCPRMLVILSPASVNSKNVLDEVSFAMEEQKTVLPVLYQECHIPFRLRRVQYVDFTKDYNQALQRLLDALAARPVPTTDVIQAAMVKEALAAEKARQEREASQTPEKPQPEDPGRQGIAAEQAHAEEERQRISAEQARLDEDQKKAAAEKARLQELERQAAEEKSKQAEAERQAIAAEQARLQQERQRLAAEQARLEEEREQAAAEKAHLLQLEQERQAAAEKARLEEKRKQAAAQKARREQEERDREVAAEKARVEAEERERAAAAQAQAEREARQRREAEEKQRLAAASAVVVVPAEPPVTDDVPFVSDSPQSSWMKPALIGLAVVVVIGLISVLVWQRSNEADEREAYARSIADERARADRAQQQAANQQSSAAKQSSQSPAPVEPAKPEPEKPKPATTAKVDPPNDLTKNSSSVITYRPLVNTPPANNTASQPPAGLSASVAESYRKAQGGNSDAMVNVGFAYDQGKGAPQDYGEAMKWYRKAADAGNSWGMSNLGAMYEAGDGGLSQDYRQALGWYRKAADAGNPRAMARLGVMYEKGIGVENSLPQALQWYRKAADTGDPNGQNDLAWFYATCSDPTFRNPTAALEYALKAVRAGGANPSPEYLDTLAEAYYVNRRYQDAVDTEQRAISTASAQRKTEFQKSLGKYQLALAANNLRP